MKQDCRCCRGAEKVTPRETANRPGLDALAYRVGTHATFLSTMLAQLSAHRFEADGAGAQAARPLRGLKTRETSDPSVALLDAWATVADVLTFYQERIANEGYLRTATERRSVIELARLVGYRPRPGVAASVYLAYTVEPDSREVLIPAGHRVQSVPGPGEKAQTFETSEPLRARPQWNLLPPRATRPQKFTFAGTRVILPDGDKVFLKGTSTRLAVNDPLLIVIGEARGVFRVIAVEPNAAADLTAVTLVPWVQTPQTLPPLQPGALKGEVGMTHDDGRDSSAPNVSVTIRSNTPAQTKTVLTDNKGGFLFGGLEPGSYSVRARLPGYVDAEAAVKVERGATADAGMLWLKVPPAAQPETATGRVLDNGGAAVSGARVTLSPASGTSPPPRGTNTNDQGTFNFPNVNVNVYRVRVEAPGFSPVVTAERTLIGSKGINFGDIVIEPAGSAPAPAPAHASINELAEAVTTHLDIESAGVSARSVTAGKVVDSLAQFKASLGAEPDPAAVHETLTGELLPELKRVQSLPSTKRSVSLSSWLATIVSDLEGAAAGLRADATPQPAAALPSDAGGTNASVPGAVAAGGSAESSLSIISKLADQLKAPASKPPQSSQHLGAAVEQTFGAGGDVFARLLGAFDPSLSPLLYAALESAPINPPLRIEVYALRVRAGLFGANAGLQPQFEPPNITVGGQTTTNPRAGQPLPTSLWTEWNPAPDEAPRLLYLDNVFDKILPDTFAAVLRPDKAEPAVYRTADAKKLSRNAYGLSAATTLLTLGADWWRPAPLAPPDPEREQFRMIRGTTVFAQAEPLALAEETVTESVCEARITLDGVYEGLEAGRWLIITGERTDVLYDREQTGALPAASVAEGGLHHAAAMSEPPAAGFEGNSPPVRKGVPVKGLPASELVMLAGVEHGYDPQLPGDTMHTTLVLTAKPAYCYGRGSVKIYGNVVKATHGETQEEVLGSGDASRALQSFTLGQSPLTFVSATTPSGTASTLSVRVNDIRWDEADTLARLGPTDRGYVTRTDEEDATAVTFGNGERGARPATGFENIKAVYRTGIGRGGNVGARKITSLVQRPLGVSAVVNPLAATGGADREGRDEVRRNAPLALLALDRLVSLRDYEDFARTFAGVGKAVAARLSDGRREVVYLTIAGADDVPIAPTSDLFRNLLAALRAFGDPFRFVRVALRELLLIYVQAEVRLHPAYRWDVVEPKMRAALLSRFSFARRELGQDVTSSEVVSAMQAVEGVSYVDLNRLGAGDLELFRKEFGAGGAGRVPPSAPARIRVAPARSDPDAPDEKSRLKPAQLALLSPAVPETIILSEI